MAFHTSLIKAIALFALLRSSEAAHASAGPEEAMTASKEGVDEHTFGTSLLPTEVTITEKHHKTSALKKQDVPQHKASISQAKATHSKTKDAFLGSAESSGNRALPSSFLAASSSSSSTSSSHASLMTDRSLEPLESLELDSTLEGLGQHDHNEGEDEYEPGAYRIAPEDAPKFPGSVLETGGESDEQEEDSDQEDYQGLGLSASESRSMRDAFHGAHKKSGSLLDDLDLAHRQKKGRKSPSIDDSDGLSSSSIEDLELPHSQNPRRKTSSNNKDESDSLSSSLLEDLEISHRDKTHRAVTSWDDDKSDDDEMVLDRRAQNDAFKQDAEDDELLRKDNGDDITEEATQSLRSLRQALQGSSVTDLHDEDLPARPKHGKTKHGSPPKPADINSLW